jgi:sugar lactone lactonase YvrE
MKSTKSPTIGRRDQHYALFQFRRHAISLIAVFVISAFASITSTVAATVQNLFTSVRSGTNGIIYLYTPNGTKSIFASGLNQPWGLACDSSGDLYVAVWGNGGSGVGSIYEFTPAGVQTTFSSGLSDPTGIAFDSSGDLFVADYWDGTIYKISGGTRSTFATGVASPTGIACDSSGNVYVGTGSGYIYKITPGGTKSTFAFINNETESNRFFRLTFDSAGDLFVGDSANDAIYEFIYSGGTLSSSATTFNAGVNLPDGLSFDSAGDLFEADTGSGKIQNFANISGKLSSSPATFVSGAGTMYDLTFQPLLCGGPAIVQNLFVSFRKGTNGIIYLYTPNGTKSTFVSGLRQPYGVASDAAGNLYVSIWGTGASGNGSIAEFTPGGVQTTFASGLFQPACMAFDSVGDMFESDYGDGNIYKFSGGTRTTFASGLSNPSGVAIDSAGNLYVGTVYGYIYKYTPTGAKSTFAFINADGEGGTFFRLAFDRAGDLFAADNENDAIYEFVNISGTLSTSATIFDSALNLPTGLAFENAGDMFEADMGSDKINEFVNTSGTLSTTPATFASGLFELMDLTFQSLGPVPYGYKTFLAYDPNPPYPSIPFPAGVTYSRTNDTIYATAGNDNNGSSIYNGDAFTYGIPSNLNYDPVYSDILDSPGNYADDDSGPGAPTVGSDGTTYVVTPSAVLYALNPDGSAKWIYYGMSLDGANVYATPTIGLDGNIYIATDDGNRIFVFYCIDPQLGLPKWKLNMATSGASFGDIDASPACTATGIYAEDEFNGLHYITYLGQQYTPISFNGQGSFPSSSPAVTPQGHLCVGDGSGNLDIVDPTPIDLGGQGILQSCSLDGSTISASPVIGADGNVYVGTTSGNFFAVQLPANEATTAPTVIAEASLGSAPTTAAVGSDSRVYVGTSALPGTFYSLQVKPVCDETLPDEFVVDWQYTNTEGGFVGAPLVAQVGSNHSTNVVYAPNEDGNIYAFLASAGPSTNTWSTFHGNDQRQGNWGNTSITLPEVWNIQFGSPSSTLSQTGKAAFGNSNSDYWNPGSVPNDSNPSYTVYDYADSSSAPELSITTSASSGLYGTDVPGEDRPFNDNMMAHYMYSANQFTVTVSGLPTQYLNNSGLNNNQALYDVYVYAYGGQQGSTFYNSEISISPTGTDPVGPTTESPKTTCQNSGNAAPPTDLDYFTQNYDNEQGGYENGEYVVFHNVPANSLGQLQITVTADPSNSASFPLINGIQIVAKQ